jgi:hypothetical protein
MSHINGEAGQVSKGELDRLQDAEWALRDTDVQRQFEGEWVVAYHRQIIAHGRDPKFVVQAAICLVGDQGHRIVFCAPDDSDRWFDSSSDAEPTNG